MFLQLQALLGIRDRGLTVRAQPRDQLVEAQSRVVFGELFDRHDQIDPVVVERVGCRVVDHAQSCGAS